MNNAIDTDFNRMLLNAFATLDRLNAEARAYWASPEGRAVAQAKREAAQAEVAAARAAQVAKLESLRAEVESLTADRAALRAELAATPMADRATRAELTAEINDVGAALAQVNAKAIKLAKEIK